MKTLTCKLCGKSMGEMERGKIRNGYVILCNECWDRAEIAIEMAEMARKGFGGTSTPDFLKNIFDEFGKG